MANPAGWTYTQDPSLATRDQVRLLVGDTDPSARLFTDAEVAWFLSEEPDVYAAAAAAARGLSARFATGVTKQVGDLKISFGERQKHYASLAIALDLRSGARSGTVFAGGISRTDKDAEEAKTDREPPQFEKGMHDNPDRNARRDTHSLRDDL